MPAVYKRLCWVGTGNMEVNRICPCPQRAPSPSREEDRQ